jgi:hypothetical protein
MDFADADGVREALSLFEARKILEVNSEAPASVRMTPVSREPRGGITGALTDISPQENKRIIPKTTLPQYGFINSGRKYHGWTNFISFTRVGPRIAASFTANLQVLRFDQREFLTTQTYPL